MEVICTSKKLQVVFGRGQSFGSLWVCLLENVGRVECSIEIQFHSNTRRSSQMTCNIHRNWHSLIHPAFLWHYLQWRYSLTVPVNIFYNKNSWWRDSCLASRLIVMRSWQNFDFVGLYYVVQVHPTQVWTQLACVTDYRKGRNCWNLRSGMHLHVYVSLSSSICLLWHSELKLPSLAKPFLGTLSPFI